MLEDFPFSRLRARVEDARAAEALREHLQALEIIHLVQVDGESGYVTQKGADGQELLVAFESQDDAFGYAYSRYWDSEVIIDRFDFRSLFVDIEAANLDGFGLGIVLSGGATAVQSTEPPRTLPAPPPEVHLEVTAVPEALFASDVHGDVDGAEHDAANDDEPCRLGLGYADQDLDDANLAVRDGEKVVWVLMYDEGSADAHLYSVALNGTVTVLCFGDEDAAARHARGRDGHITVCQRSLGEIFDELHESLGTEDAGRVDICLIKDVLLADGVFEADGHKQRAMLDRLYYFGWGDCM